MDKISALICMYVDKNLSQLVNHKVNKKVYRDFSLLARYAYENRTVENSATWLLKELLKHKLGFSAHKGFWQTFDALVGSTFNTYISNIISMVVDTPSEYGFDIQYVRAHFIEQQLKEIQPRTLPEEIRWFVAGAVQDYICSTAFEEEHQPLLEICLGDFGQPYIEHLLLHNSDVHDFINNVAQSLLK